ncbi:MAG: hypothetical protein GF308_14245 [Candidatus Heimdallarchaeota archaeon]|nr:hypothetical protein [Candidatus Heimdallarchaeota archaeon]
MGFLNLTNNDSDAEGIFCPICGAYQQKDSRFCGSCGADLQAGESIIPDESIPEVTEGKSDFEYSFELPSSEEPSHQVETITPSSSDSSSESSARTSFGQQGDQSRGYYSSTPSSYGQQYHRPPPPPQYRSKQNATIALILGIVGFFVNCCLIPLIGLHYVKKAEQNREDSTMISAAKILLYIQLCLMIIGFIILIFAFMSY